MPIERMSECVTPAHPLLPALVRPFGVKSGAIRPQAASVISPRATIASRRYVAIILATWRTSCADW
mgnify:CR=1 FL=1